MDTANPFFRKLQNFTQFSEADEALLHAVTSERSRKIGAREDIVREGDRPETINLVQSGWGCRYKTLEDGRRQMVSLLLPGDMCDLNVFVLRHLDHTLSALTPVVISEISRHGFDELMGSNERIRQALWWESFVAQATQREWVLNIGQRSAYERTAHLLCEIFIRLRMVGLTEGDHCEFVLTQTDLGEALGLSTVHVNRTLQELRAASLIVLRERTLWIPDLEALKDAALFDDAYLHLDHEGAHLGSNS